MGDIDAAHHASQALGIVRDDFIEQEQAIIKLMLSEFDSTSGLKRDKAFGYIGQLLSLRKYIRSLEKKVDAGARERQKIMG